MRKQDQLKQLVNIHIKKLEKHIYYILIKYIYIISY